MRGTARLLYQIHQALREESDPKALAESGRLRTPGHRHAARACVPEGWRCRRPLWRGPGALEHARDDAGDAAQRRDSLHRVARARVMGWPGARDEVWDPASVCVPGRITLESLDSLRKRMYTDEDWDSLGTRSLGRGGCWRVHAGVRHAPSDSAQAESANARVRPVALLALHLRTIHPRHLRGWRSQKT